MICSTIVTSDGGRNERPARRVSIGSSISVIRPIVLAKLSLVLIALFSFLGSAQGQWMIKTPRDTVKVFANQKARVKSLLSQPSKVMVAMTFTKTFGAVTGQNGTGFDARYMYEQFPGWSTPTPLANPPTYANKSYQIYLGITDNNGITLNGINTIETNYQPNHKYTALYSSSGVPFQFVIMNRLNEKPDGFYYSQGTGYIQVELARFTAGVRVQKPNLDFGSVAIGYNLSLTDSIESYGIDPLQIDSAHIEAAPGSPGWNDFSFTSQNGFKYALPSETTNEYKVTFTPSQRADSYAHLVIYCRNTDGPSRVVTIPLHGVGTAPVSVIGPNALDFGKNRVNFATQPKWVNVSNVGNGSLDVTGVVVTPADGIFSATPLLPFQVGAASMRQVTVSFKPTTTKKYTAKLTITTNATTQVIDLAGEGAAPKLNVNKTQLDFGTVRRNDQNTLKFTLSNDGNWTSSIRCFLSGPSKSNFTYTPGDTNILLNPGQTREYTITFSPATGPEGNRNAELDFYEDDGSAPLKVGLIGVEAEPKLIIGRQLVDFGKRPIGILFKDTVSLTNTSNATLGFLTPIVLPVSSPFGVLVHGPTVEPNVKDSLVVTFRPFTRGQFSAKVFTDANGQKDSITLIGIGAVPKAVFTPPVIDFGTVVTGKLAQGFTVLSDTGDYPLHVASFTVSPDNQGFSIPVAMPTPPFTVNENSFGVSLYVQFQTMARTGKAHYAYLVVHYAEGGSDSVLMIAKEQAEFVHFNESGLDFGKVHVGQSLEKLATFSHGSVADLSVGRAWVEQPSVFHSDSSTILVPSGKNSQTRVVFQPMVKGTFKGILQDSGIDVKGRDTLYLTGVGAEGVATLSDDTLDFGLVYHRLSGAKSLSLRNDGDWDLGWSWKIVGDQFGEFSFLPSDTSTTLAEAKSTDFAVRFTPKQPKYPTHEADLVFTFDNGTSSTVHLIAWDSIPFLALDSDVIDFGKIRIPNTSSRTVHLVNTTPLVLKATNVGIVPVTAPYSYSTNPPQPSGTITVNGPKAEDVQINFAPTAIGSFNAELDASGNDMLDSIPDKVILHGIGAMPVPVFSKSVIDFGRLTIGNPATGDVILTNQGNWDLHITSVKLSGANQIDYTYSFPQDTVIKEGESTLIPFGFVAKTGIQATPRLGSLDFTMDDGTTFSIPLTELDKAPLETEIGFDNYLARPGDGIHVPLQLRTFIPPELTVRSLSGEITFDPAVVQLTWYGKGPLIGSDRWKINWVESGGKLTFEITSDTLEEILSDKGVLLRLNFLAHPGSAPGAKTELHVNLLTYPDTKEVVGVEKVGVIVIDSSCGSTHIMEGMATANMVDQNTPNPFGSGMGAEYTYIPFDVGEDGTLVSIRILDETGKEVLRLVDNLSYVQGRYRVRVHAQSLKSGLYFYEFRAGTAKPVIKKMVVAD